MGDKPKFEKQSIVESVDAKNVKVTLWNDLERFSNGLIHAGYGLANFTHDGKEGYVTAGGNEITVNLNGRTWGINLQELICIAIDADSQRESKLKSFGV